MDFLSSLDTDRSIGHSEASIATKIATEEIRWIYKSYALSTTTLRTFEVNLNETLQSIRLFPKALSRKNTSWEQKPRKTTILTDDAVMQAIVLQQETRRIHQIKKNSANQSKKM